MKKNKVSGAEISLYTLLIICLLIFLYIDKVHAQDSVRNDVNAQVEDPSPEKAAEAAEKKQTLEELLAVPFNQIKQEQEEELGLSGDGSESDKKSKRDRKSVV